MWDTAKDIRRECNGLSAIWDRPSIDNYATDTFWVNYIPLNRKTMEKQQIGMQNAFCATAPNLIAECYIIRRGIGEISLLS